MKEQLKKADLYGLLIIAAAMVVYWVRGEWTLYHTIAVSVGGLLVLVALILRASEIRAGLGRRSTKFGIHSTVSVIALVGILALVNYLGARHSKQVDMTDEKLYSLSEQSTELLDNQIKEDVTIKAFFLTGGEAEPIRQRAQDLLGLYSSRNSKVTVEFIDPEKQPQLAKSYDIQVNGTLVVEMGGNKERIQKDRFVEEDVTNALIKLAKGQKKTIYFLEGHGEKQITDMGPKGYSLAGDQLGKENYTVKTLSLAREGKVPADASVVVVAGPTREPFPEELNVLDEYAKGGGSVLIMLDPPPDTASMSDFAKQWSVEPGQNVVIERNLMNQIQGTASLTPTVRDYGSHPIAERLQGQFTFFPEARSMTPIKPPVEGVTVEPLLMGSDSGWAETDLKGLAAGKLALDAGQDIPGPVTLGVVATRDLGENKKTRLVFIGDSDFANNTNYPQQLNGDLFSNTIAWLSRDESFITIRAKDPTNREVTMTQSQLRVLQLLALVLFPGVILITGISVWASRRK